MSNRYAIVCNNIVQNVILWDGKTDYNPPEDCSLIECSDEVGIGFTYKDGEFHPPPIEEEE